MIWRPINYIVALMLVGSVFVSASSPTSRRWRPIEFHLAEYHAAPGLIPAQVIGQDSEVFLHPRAELDDRDLDRAETGKGKFGESLVRVHLTKIGAKKMRTLCKKYQQRFLAIVVNGKVVSVPVIFGPMNDDVLEITGHLSEEDTARLTQSLGAR